MTKQEFIEAIESIYELEVLDDAEGFQLHVDDFYGDITIFINLDDTFNIDIDIFNESNYFRDYTEKYSDAFTLACYKSVCFVLDNKSNIDHEPVKSQRFDSERGIVYTIRYLCKKFDITLINHICNALKNAYVKIDGFYGETYERALLETIANDHDYNGLKNGLKLEDSRLWIGPKGYAMIFTTDIGTKTRFVKVAISESLCDEKSGYRFAALSYHHV
jgi:hypothetical protein